MRFIVFLSIAFVFCIQLVATPAEAASKMPSCNQFLANPSSITQGDNTVLSWDTTNAKSVYIDNNIGQVAVDGSYVVAPTEDTTYTLTALNGIRYRTTCTVSVTVTVPPPVCSIFTASPTSIVAGQSSTLTWDTDNASSVSIDQGVGLVVVDGSVTVSPSATTQYTLHMEGPGGQNSCTETIEVTPSTELDLSFCADTLETLSGTLCAIAPSTIDARTHDVTPPTSSPDGDAFLGFGYHVVAFPHTMESATDVWVHLTGSYGRPYNQNTSSFGDQVWLEELMQRGYVAIQLAYDNRFSVNGDLCSQTSAGYDRDNCAGEVREIALTGLGESPFRSTDEFNTIDYRLSTLVDYLETNQTINLPETVDVTTNDWSTLDISGHSQGANQAYYIAKQRPVASACIMGGGYDAADSVNPGELNIADWFTTGISQTPLASINAFLTRTDANYFAFRAGLQQAVGLTAEEIIVDFTDPYYNLAGDQITGHAATVHDPSLASKRAEACF